MSKSLFLSVQGLKMLSTTLLGVVDPIDPQVPDDEFVVNSTVYMAILVVAVLMFLLFACICCCFAVVVYFLLRSTCKDLKSLSK